MVGGGYGNQKTRDTKAKNRGKGQGQKTNDKSKWVVDMEDKGQESKGQREGTRDKRKWMVDKGK